VADASPGELKLQLQQRSGQLVEVRCDEPSRALQMLREAGHGDAALRGRGVLLMVPDRQQAEARIAALLAAQNIALQAVLPREIDMEEVFVRRVGALQEAGEA
jgi:ABC-2 type transport system ATP-binding protein